MKVVDFTAFTAWLVGVACTKPFTVADADELRKMIKKQLPKAIVDVYYTRGDKVHVRVQDGDNLVERAIDVV